ncbi:hypothetical protein EYF80_015785 [Liparis tanakae]|uniref:Uncharacterized protein n=1 Tax=Liparis tanakae TaxID=230148 RepID=A0A4Z2I9B9_9TELE|nr:hypothetical protein EYF80_015785 [Liparis tanakae]
MTSRAVLEEVAVTTTVNAVGFRVAILLPGRDTRSQDRQLHSAPLSLVVVLQPAPRTASATLVPPPAPLHPPNVSCPQDEPVATHVR